MAVKGGKEKTQRTSRMNNIHYGRDTNRVRSLKKKGGERRARRKRAESVFKFISSLFTHVLQTGCWRRGGRGEST